ncbi:DsbA family protein [Endozoicomonas arenosclerae]|uniref:DsbA family protein n=1 Tax=Endozoicomonas arenosclerae TaxID=1633495 RepID=UPI0007817243|nr:thioredoxin domain-containing protein [Endozoicomonas arenosclerae]
MFKKSIAVLLLASASLQPALAEDGDILFSYKGKDYALKDLQSQLQQAFYTAQVKAQESLTPVLEQAIVEKYIEEIATSTDRAINDVREEMLRAEAVTKEEVKSVYEQYKDQIGRPLEEIESTLTQQLQQQKQQEKVLALIEKVKKETGFVNKMEKPEAPTFSMDLSPYPFKGPEDAKVTVVEFADYNCGYCRNSKPEIDKLLKQFGDQVKFYYIDYPVTEKGIAGSTTQTARGAYCAGQQDKFWDFYNLAYEKPVTMETAAELANTLKLDQKAFNACLTSDESAKFVKNSEKMAQSLGVTGTPTLFVNGRLLHTHDAGKDLKAELEKTLKPKS